MRRGLAVLFALIMLVVASCTTLIVISAQDAADVLREQQEQRLPIDD